MALEKQLFLYLLAGKYNVQRKRIIRLCIRAHLWKQEKIFYKNNIQHVELFF